MHLARCRLFLSALLAYVVHQTDGCGRTPARTKPSPTTPPGHVTPSPAPAATPQASHKQECTNHEINQARCLNGGSCFALAIFSDGERLARCHCREMWTGLRCEQIDGGFFVLSADKVTKAGIAAAVVAVVIIITIIVVYFVLKKRKERKKRAEESSQTNGYVHKQLIGKENQYEYPQYPPEPFYPQPTSPERGPLTLTVDKSETNV